MRYAAAFLALALVAGCAPRPAPVPHSLQAKAMVPTIYVIRHMEKAPGDDPVLSSAGEANAKRLAAALKDKDIDAIFVTDTRRSRMTAAPLAAALGLQPQVYDPKDNAALAAKVANVPGSVLVVGHSNTVPGLVAAFGGAAPAPMDESDYGRLFAIRRSDGTTVESRP